MQLLEPGIKNDTWSGEEGPRLERLAVESDGEAVELVPGKFTIGSSPRSSLQIQQEGVQPLHCLVMGHDGRWIIRRWAGEASINGKRFDEAELQSGDQLMLGSASCIVTSLEEEAESKDTPVVAAELPEDQGSDAPVEEVAAICVEALADEIANEDFHDGDEALPSEQLSPLAAAIPEELQSLHRQIAEVDERLSDLERDRSGFAQSLQELERHQLDQVQADLACRQTISDCQERIAEHLTRIEALEQQITELCRHPTPAPASELLGHDRIDSSSQRADEELVDERPSVDWESSANDATADPEADPEANRQESDDALECEDEGFGEGSAVNWFSSSTGRDGSQCEEYEDAEHDSGGLDSDWADTKESSPNEWDLSPSDLSGQHGEWADERGADVWQASGSAMEERDGSENEAAHSPMGARQGEGNASAWGLKKQDDSAADWGGAPQEECTEAEILSNEPGTGELTETAVASESHRAGQEEPESAESSSGPHVAESYIERYSHMFRDEENSSGNAAFAGSGNSGEPASSVSLSAHPSQNALSEEDEETIEQYMAKLLQRVRGEASTPAATFPATTANVAERSEPVAAASGQQTSPAQPLADIAGESTPAATAAWMQVGPGGPRKASAAPATDLEALRALANETARRAISTHSLRKHRRNAVTKVIVAMLAGMTSLWLMLQSPTWYHWQFITACGALLVAAYWTGQTYRTLLESFRVDGYDHADGDSDGDDEVRPPLPIDVELSPTAKPK